MRGSLTGGLDTSLDIVKLDCLRYAVKATIGGVLSDQRLAKMSTTDAAQLAAITQIFRKCDSLLHYSSIAGAENPENKTAGPSSSRDKHAWLTVR